MAFLPIAQDRYVMVKSVADPLGTSERLIIPQPLLRVPQRSAAPHRTNLECHIPAPVASRQRISQARSGIPNACVGVRDGTPISPFCDWRLELREPGVRHWPS